MSWNLLKHYMPRGIYGRAALILLLPVVFLQLVVTVIFAQRHFEGVTHQMTDTVLRELTLVMQIVNDAPTAPLAEQAVQAQLAPLRITALAVDVSTPENKRVWYDYSGSVLTARLATQLLNFAAVDLVEGGEVSVFVNSTHGMFKIGFDRRRISASNPHQMFVYTIAFGVLMTFIAIIYLRNQLRPIKRLARAAEAFGRGRHIPYTPSGAIELRAAGSAFVDMRQRIERHIEQRTLMLSGVSHDLRTPLTRMRLGLAMLDEDEAEPLLRDVADMQGMLDEFLDFAKGAAEGEPEPVDPIAMVTEIVDGAQRADRNVSLMLRDGEGQGTVLLREVAMRRAVDNLISNGVRYGARAEVSVMLTEKTLRIRVEDDGPGIPENKREQATRPFTRLDPSRNQNKGGGVGLGLAIAVDVARSHGGVLRLGASERLGGLRADIVIAR
jgi:two-component system osmolarity sensor histidine kinase EnvZ